MSEALGVIPFVHLHVHSEYSLVDGIVRIGPLVKQAAAMQMPAVAITDQSNLYAMVKFYKACQKAGIKPIVGADLWVAREAEDPFRLIVLCQDHQGYLNLMELISESYLKGQKLGRPIVDMQWLRNKSEGLIALSAARQGELGKLLLAHKFQEAIDVAREWESIFPGRFYLELQRTGHSADERLVFETVNLAQSIGLPVVATNAVRFLDKEDDGAHEARVCVQQGRTLDDPTRVREGTPEQYFKSPAEMGELFADLPEALWNSVQIARRCSLEVTLGKNFLPEFPLPEGFGTDDYLRYRSEQGLEERLQILLDRDDPKYEEKRKIYEERLKIELDVIIQMQFPGYFLIVADFIQWAKDNDIPVGPGRGSGAGSLVAYALKITDLDPLQYDLLFERFLNPERVSMPDFDIDFCMDGRDRVIAYVAEKYGRDSVSQIATHGTMAAKAVVRDVGRVMGLPYGFVDKIAKLIPFEVGISLTKAMEQEPELKQRYESDETVRALIDLALKLEGIARSVGKHAGGVVIAPTRLIDFSPLYCEADGTSVVTQYDKKDVEEVGLVKFDFLGLRTLTIIDWAIKAINQERRKKDQPPLDISLIPLNDPLVYDQLKSANTTAVFQLESRGMKDLIRRLRPDNFEDIIALVALFRPGPLGSGMVDDFIDRKHGVAEVDYPHPDLEPVLKPTYGIILYQEQVMQVAQVLAAYSLGAADLLRRAMGKKDKEEMQRQRAQFMDGAAKHGVDPHLAGHIFDLMEKFAEYGFNKSHSAAYALVSYQTAWLKVHYAAWFMAAVLSSDMDKTEKVVTFIEECRQMKIRVRPPDINHSRYMFFASGPDEVVYGLGAIKGVGEAVIQNIVAEREQNGAYTDLFDLCKRIDLSKANRRVLESFIKAGAMDSLERNRAVLLGSLEDEIRKAEQFSRNLNTGQVDFFGFDASASQSEKVDLPVARPQKVFSWTEEERLGFEKETLGLYLTGHPFTQFEAELSSVLTHRLVDLADGEGFGSGGREGKKVRFAGLVVGIRPRILESGKKMLLISLDDRTGQFEVPLIGEALEREGNKVVKDKVLIVDATLKYDPFRERMRTQVERFYSLEQVREIFGRRLVVSVAAENVSSTLADQLEKILLPYVKGRCPVCLEYRGKSASAFLELGSEWRVKPYDELLRQLAGLGEIRLEF